MIVFKTKMLLLVRVVYVNLVVQILTVLIIKMELFVRVVDVMLVDQILTVLLIKMELFVLIFNIKFYKVIRIHQVIILVNV
jgi:hypothetical protein